ncbi:hypothetical protein RvY_13852-2 [Ramazzottius varieornatus]|uniref:Cytochrome P450 n=1 Tax=Ramazzottius varieornatus TaxID=947166 RepID=A0A1D1VUI9_RAMVA|nr:hypothetical protein RvY_13852-2 [Ramazzottius varieornatus]
MYLIFFNIALWSAVVYCIARTIKQSFEAEVRHIIGLFRDPKLPPGPLGIPFFGSLSSVAGTDSYTAFSQLAKRYGGQVFLRVGKKNIFVMREPAMIKEAYRQTAFSDRPKTFFKDKDLIGNKGIIQSTGNVWQEHRRLILSAFRTIGLKSSASVTPRPQTSQIAEVMLRDVEEYLQFVDQFVVNQADGHIMLEKLTGRLAGSSISSCVFGLKKSFADKEFSHNVEVIEEGFFVGEKVAPFELFPLLKSVPALWKPVQAKLKQNHGCTCKYFRSQIDEKVATEAACDKARPDSLITIYRNEMAKREASLQPQILSEIQLMQTMTDMFCAGTETVKYSLMWSMLYMAKHPEVQAAVQQELDAFVRSTNSSPSWQDVSLLPYTEATILECLRIRPVLPFGHPRAGRHLIQPSFLPCTILSLDEIIPTPFYFQFTTRRRKFVAIPSPRIPSFWP